MLQTAEERLWKKWAKASKEEIGPSSPTSAMTTDGLPSLTNPSLASSSSSLVTAPPFPSFTPSTITPDNTPKEISLPPTLQNPSPLAASVALFEDMVAAVTANSSPLFPILQEVSPPVFSVEPPDASSPLVSLVNTNTSSTSDTPHSSSSFSFALNIPIGDYTPSPLMSWSPPPSPAFVS